MADFDKAAHEMMRFRAGKYAEFESGRFLVAYHEDRLYPVRDTKRGTVTLVEARNPEEAYRVIGQVESRKIITTMLNNAVSWSYLEEFARCKRYNYSSNFVADAKAEWERSTRYGDCD